MDMAERDFVRDWVDGWTLSRGAALPIVEHVLWSRRSDAAWHLRLAGGASFTTWS